LVVIIQPAQHASSDQSLRHKSLAADTDLACRLVMITSVDKNADGQKEKEEKERVHGGLAKDVFVSLGY
jgi:hypothetical protein